MSRPLNWKVSPEERRLIALIARRAIVAFDHLSRFEQDWEMDVTAVHKNGCPLRLNELAAADAFTFAHDLGGIYRHLNRDTGQLKDCFVPRCAVSQ